MNMMYKDSSFVHRQVDSSVRAFVRKCVPSRKEYNRLVCDYCKKYAPNEVPITYKQWVDGLVSVSLDKKWSQDEIKYVINMCVAVLKNGIEND